MTTRVAVPLTQEAYDAVSLICKLSGVSRGKFLADTLEAAIPGFIKIADAYRMAHAVDGEERKAILDGMQAAERALMRAMQETDLLSLMEADSTSTASASKEARGAGEGRSDPPILTGGFPTPNLGGDNEV